ncbi:DUF3145 family protein [Rothia sp. P7181]|uniref:DUF3145 family protein n=1 Tax=unclassified Rothia (in: high G+C Gram-positive bacteria) TaxID=2689056 RepID=UPI003ACCBC31
MTSGGILYIHAVPAVAMPHLKWSLENLIEGISSVTWDEQTQKPEHYCATLEWKGSEERAAQIISALIPLKKIWFELSFYGDEQELPSWWMHTPEHGTFYAPTDTSGNFLISEDRVRSIYEQSGGEPDELLQLFSQALGEPWNNELEPLRESTADLQQPIILERRINM